ncbi:MAG: response regulator [Anaerolineae bacterium]|nr:response regulator [Anaerolineae bacterium]
MRILLIEDNQMNAEIFMRICDAKGYSTITHCILGRDALEQAHKEAFDLIFVDFDLPDINGLQVGLSLAWEMQRGKIGTSPLIALTAQSDKASQEEAQRLGFHAFLGKPFTEADVSYLLEYFGARR